MMRSIYDDKYRRLLGFMLQVREALGITQVSLAQRLRTTQSYVSKCERGERRIDVIEYVRYCEALGVDAAVLMDVFLDHRLGDTDDRAVILATLLRKSRRRERTRRLSGGATPTSASKS